METKKSMQWEYKQPVKVLFGNGKRWRLADEIKALGGRCGLLVTSPSFVKRGTVKELTAACENVQMIVFSEVSANPDVKECDACAQLIRDNGCDFVVALGGGSVMDCAKTAACICKDTLKTESYMVDRKPLPDAHLPLIALPTTAGTASEVTKVAVLSDRERKLKASINSDALFPTVALVDPELTYTVPKFLTACTGFDALCHAIEAYWNVNHQPACDVAAIYAIRLVLENVETVCNEPENKVARENMMLASLMAGFAFSQTGTSSSHACSYPVTSLLGVPHGEACALTIDYFVRFNAKHGCERTKSIANQLGYPNAEALADEIHRLKKITGILTSLADFNVSDSMLTELVNGSKRPNLKCNPIEITEEDLRTMFASLTK
ncbi:MAG: iron-containing alcohol dehydrogenase [Prevotella sp.]|nr:iron-containing alcohol dehydrogenase [Prevotella sp.]